MRNIKTAIASITSHLGLFDAYAFLRRKFTKSQVAILVYHRISPKSDNWSYKPLSPQLFKRQIEYFCRKYEILPLDKLAQYIRKERPLPDKAVAITFDDGYKDNYLHAYPILKKLRIPASIFLITSHIGTDKLFWWDKIAYTIQHTALNRLDLTEIGSFPLESELNRSDTADVITERLKILPDEKKIPIVKKLIDASGVEISPDLGKEFMLSWDDVKEMANDSIDFGSHSVSHQLLTHLSLEQVRWEIVQSKKDIEERLKQPVTAFSYPHGAFNAEIARLVKESGFTYAVSTLPKKLISPADDLYSLSRIPVVEDFNKFKAMFCGLWADLGAVF